MERKDDNFASWLKEKLSKYKISQSKLAREIGIDQTYICKIVCEKMIATEKIKYLIINFFRENYEEDMPVTALEKLIPATFGEWLSLETTKHDISSEELAKAMGIGSNIIRDIWTGRTISTIERKMKILECLEKVYGIDTTKGEQLLENTINNEKEKYSIWISNTMNGLNIGNAEIAKYLGIGKDNFSKIRTGRVVPSVRKAELIFRFFEEHGIDTIRGREIYKKLHQGTIKYKK